jgi:branched-chain amino acid transport system ATP-binding protein
MQSPATSACARSIWAKRMLEIEGIRAGYGDAVVLDDVSLQVKDGGSLAVLGRNGVGKSTLLLTIMGYTRLHFGKIRFNGKDIAALPPHKRAQAGIGWVAQEREIFPSLTVEENLTVAARPGTWTLAGVYELFPRLKERKGNLGNQLSGGEQQMLAVARTLMTNPQLLLLDEPLEGLAPIIVEELAASLKNLQGMAMILVEQHMDIALSLTRDAVVIERGRIVHRAASAELARDTAMHERLLGLKVG